MIRISVSQLATLDRCEKCFYLAAKGFIKESVQTLPSYFTILIQNELKNNNNTPSWLNTENGTLVHLNPNQKRFKTNYKHFSIVGVVDDFLQIAENKCVLVRYKTLPFSERRVENELTILAWVCEVDDINVTEAYIFAFTPIRFHSELCSLQFEVSKSVVDIDTSHVPALLDKANEIIKLEEPPKPSPECRRCGFAFIENNKGDNGNNGYFSFSKINQIKNINKPHGGRKEKKCHFCHYDHYEIDQITPELLNNDFENLGGGECEGCHEQKSDLWSVKIGNKEAGFCIGCIKDAIEQAREKKEGDAEEAKKQEQEVKEKPTPIEIKKFTIGASKCKSCGKDEIDLIYVVHYSNEEFKNVCGDCGEQIMQNYGIKVVK